ncbi:MAG: acyl-CoA dehydrogenase family protein [Mycobacterium sp.]
MRLIRTTVVATRLETPLDARARATRPAQHRLVAEQAPHRAKLYATEQQWQIMDRYLRLHGGYGYINEYGIARI